MKKLLLVTICALTSLNMMGCSASTSRVVEGSIQADPEVNLSSFNSDNQLDSNNNFNELINEQFEQFTRWLQQEDTQNTLRELEKMIQDSSYEIQRSLQESIREAERAANYAQESAQQAAQQAQQAAQANLNFGF